MIKKDKYQELREWFVDDDSPQYELSEQWKLIFVLLRERDKLFKENKQLRKDAKFWRLEAHMVGEEELDNL